MIHRIKRSYLLVLFLLCKADLNATLDVSASIANAIGIQLNGSIVVAGSVTGNELPQLMLARYNAFGAIDLNYGQYGYLASSIGNSCTANALMVQENNQVVTIGGLQSILGYGFVIARYNPNGTADLNFNGNGVQTTFFNGNAVAYDLAVDAEGNYVVAGLSVTASKPAFVLARYTPAGQLDTGFGSGGIVTTSINQGCEARSIALNSSGNIVIAGYSINVQGNTKFALACYTSQGSLDQSFNGNGIVTTAIGLNSRVNSIVIQSNNQIIAGGYSNNQFALARYNTNGSLDTTFGTDGIVITSIGSNAQIRAIALQSNGRIIAVGYSDNQYALARYTSNGILDISFGSRGVVTTTIGVTANATAVTLAPNGNIIVAGNTATGVVVATYDTNGSLDTLFGNNGFVNFPNTFDAPDVFNIANVNIATNADIAYSKLDLSNSIVNSDINSSAAIEDTKLASIVTPGKVLNTATTASSLNISGAIVARDTLGNFEANTFYGNVVGNVQGAASANLLKAGDTMQGALILPAGNAVAPSLQFDGSENTGLSAVLNTLALSTNGFERVTIDNNGSVTIKASASGAALSIGSDTIIDGNTSNAGNIAFNTDGLLLNAVGSTQGPLMKIYAGVGNTSLAGSVTVDYTAAGFNTVPIICMNPINGISALLTIRLTTNTSAVITSLPVLNVPFNYIAIGI